MGKRWILLVLGSWYEHPHKIASRGFYAVFDRLFVNLRERWYFVGLCGCMMDLPDESPALLEYRLRRVEVMQKLCVEYLADPSDLVSVEIEDLAALDGVQITEIGEENIYFVWNGICCFCKCL